MNKSMIWIVLVIVVVLGGGWLLMSKSSDAPADEGAMMPAENTGAQENIGSQGSENGTSGSSADKMAPEQVTVTYTSTGFSPKSVTVKKGTQVTFVNQSGKSMWVGSASHPDHTKYSGTDKSAHCPDTSGTAFDQCASGDTYSFTFEKVGSWGYHNHTASTDWGTVVVTE